MEVRKREGKRRDKQSGKKNWNEQRGRGGEDVGELRRGKMEQEEVKRIKQIKRTEETGRQAIRGRRRTRNKEITIKKEGGEGHCEEENEGNEEKGTRERRKLVKGMEWEG